MKARRLHIALLVGTALAMNPPPGLAQLTLPLNTWTRVTPLIRTGGPGFYQNQAWTTAAYDAARGRMLVWEGYIATTAGYPETIYSNSIWGFNAANDSLTILKLDHWYNGPGPGYDTVAYPENTTDPTPADRHPCFAYASDKRALYAFGGLNYNIQGISPNHPDDTWMFGLDSLKWRQLSPATHPVSGQDAVWPAMAYDPSTRNIVIVNAPAVPYGTRYTWLLNVDTEQYTMLNTSPTPSLGGGGGNALAYDGSRRVVWLFGASSTGPVYTEGGNELWYLDAATRTWRHVYPSGTLPPKRIYQGLVYIPRYDVLLLYGGSAGDEGAQLTDTWVYTPSLNSWNRLAVNSPSSSKFVDMIYDEAHDVVTAQLNSGEWWLFRLGSTSSDVLAPSSVRDLRAR